MADNQYDFERQIDMNFIDMLRDDWDDLADDEREAWGAESVAERYDYSGQFHEMVDGMVPIYTREIVKLWLDLDMPDANEMAGHEVSEMSIIQQMQVGIYCWADEYARRNFEAWHEEVISAVTTK
jgi:hypothetical protein